MTLITARRRRAPDTDEDDALRAFFDGIDADFRDLVEQAVLRLAGRRRDRLVLGPPTAAGYRGP